MKTRPESFTNQTGQESDERKPVLERLRQRELEPAIKKLVTIKAHFDRAGRQDVVAKVDQCLELMIEIVQDCETQHLNERVERGEITDKEAVFMNMQRVNKEFESLLDQLEKLPPEAQKERGLDKAKIQEMRIALGGGGERLEASIAAEKKKRRKGHKRPPGKSS